MHTQRILVRSLILEISPGVKKSTRNILYNTKNGYTRINLIRRILLIHVYESYEILAREYQMD